MLISTYLDWSPRAIYRLKTCLDEPFFLLQARLALDHPDRDTIVNYFPHLILEETKQVVQF